MYFAARIVTHTEDLYNSRIMQRYAKDDHAAYCNGNHALRPHTRHPTSNENRCARHQLDGECDIYHTTVSKCSISHSPLVVLLLKADSSAD